MLHCILEENIDFFFSIFPDFSYEFILKKKKQDKMWNKVAT